MTAILPEPERRLQLRARLGFIDALRFFLLALKRVLGERALRAWYLKALVRTLLIALTLVILLIALGSYGLWTWIGTAYGGAWGGLASALYVIVAVYVSGTITAAVSSSLVQLVSGERALLIAVGIDSLVAADLTPRPSLARHRFREYGAIALSVLVSLTIWPLLIFPLTLPLGIGVFAWALGQENHKAADRLLLERAGMSSWSLGLKARAPAHIGLGLVPAVLFVIPFVGWMTLPLLQIAAVLGQRELIARGRHVKSP